jgi:hypothetical protein
MFPQGHFLFKKKDLLLLLGQTISNMATHNPSTDDNKGHEKFLSRNEFDYEILYHISPYQLNPFSTFQMNKTSPGWNESPMRSAIGK